MTLALSAMLSLLLATALATAQETTAKPAAPQPRASKPAAAQATTAMTVTVTDQSGAPIGDVRVMLSGPVERSGSTQSTGVVRFDGMRPGSYRLKFSKEGFVLLERELDIRTGQPTPNPSVTLTAADAPPPPPAPAPTPLPEPSKTGTMPPPGNARTVDVLDFIERNFITNKEPQKVSSVSCSGMSHTWLWQVREPWNDRRHSVADASLYVIGGEGTLRLDGRDTPLAAGTFAQVPRNASYSVTRRGRNPVMILATLVGEPCPQ